MKTRRITDTLSPALAVIAALAVLGALYAVFFEAPPLKGMSVASRIFYFHVGSAINMLLVFVLSGLAGLVYLVSPRSRAGAVADAVNVATAEVGVMLGAVVLVTGPLWARKEWGTFWTWEPRLTLSLLVFFMFLAFLALRSFAGSERFSRAIAAGLSVMGIPAAWFIHFAVERWGGAHPQVVYKGGLESDTARLVFLVSVVAVSILSASLVSARARIEMMKQSLDKAFLDLDADGGRS